MHTQFVNIEKEDRNEHRDKAIKSLAYYMQTVSEPLPTSFYATEPPEQYYVYTLVYESGKVFHYLRFYLDDNNVPTQIEFVYSRTDGPTKSVIFNVTRNEWAQDLFAKLLRSGKIYKQLRQTKTEKS